MEGVETRMRKGQIMVLFFVMEFALMGISLILNLLGNEELGLQIMLLAGLLIGIPFIAMAGAALIYSLKEMWNEGKELKRK